VIAKPEEKKVVEMVDVAIDPKTPPPPPLPQIEIPKIETVKFVPIEVAKTDQEVKEEKVATQKQLENTTAGTQNQDGVKDTSGTMSLNNVGPGKLGGIEDGQEKEDIWLGPVTKEANFDGGHVKYIQTHVSPSLLEYIADRGIKGTITFFAIIDKEGKVRDVSVLKGQEIGNCPRCTEEVKRIIETMPSWIPAENNGMKVMRRISVRIKF
jgi:protein TonB